MLAVLEAYAATGPVVRVFGVPSNCNFEVPGGRAYGFIDAGDCVSGLELAGDVYLVLQDGMRYSYVLCHEIKHVLIGDTQHRAKQTWGPTYGGDVGDSVPTCNSYIRDRLGPEDEIRWQPL